MSRSVLQSCKSLRGAWEYLRCFSVAGGHNNCSNRSRRLSWPSRHSPSNWSEAEPSPARAQPTDRVSANPDRCSPLKCADARCCGCHRHERWRGWMGTEPTQDASQRPANGFEGRVGSVRNRPPTSAPVQSRGATDRDRPHSSAVIRPLGCLFGCRRTHLLNSLAHPHLCGPD
jgi:hypothetical protein